MTRNGIFALGSRIVAAGLLLVGVPGAGHAAEPGDGPRLREVGVTVTQAQIEAGELALEEIRRQGRLIFSTPFNKADGYGDGPVNPADPTSPGGRPTLQGNGTFLRVNGLDGQTCLECHSIISNATVPARFGIGGVGGSVTNAIFQPTLMDVREADIKFNGRFINPPFLFGSGGVELLANEMTEDLQAKKAYAIAHPGKDVRLRTKRVNFGWIRYENGVLDTSRVEGVDPDLVVRPFGRKGEFETVRSFDLGAMAFHFGLQPVEVVGAGVDADGDGVVDEIEPGEISALEIFNTTLDRPHKDWTPRAVRRRRMQLFREAGCAECHRPMLATRGEALDYRYPEVPDDPTANVYAGANLADAPTGFTRRRRGGLKVPLFADLKRHYMGPQLAESFGSDLDIMFTTARLWGVADTAPYLHDGRATMLRDAIMEHGGDAEDARDAFAAATSSEQADLLALLRTLRTPEHPAADLDN